MPVTGSNNAEKGPGGGGRTTFRPPWVKETGAQSTPAATNKAPWAKKPDTSAASKENGQPTVKEAKLQSREIKVPVMTTKLKPVPPPLKPKEERRDSNVSEKSDSDTVADAPVKREGKLEKPKLRHVEAAPKEKTKTPNRLPEQPKLRPVLEKTPKVEEKAPPPFERKLSAVADRKGKFYISVCLDYQDYFCGIRSRIWMCQISHKFRKVIKILLSKLALDLFRWS